MEELNYISKFHDHLNREEVMLAYDGVLSKDIVASFLTRLRKDIDYIDVTIKEKKRFFSIVVECIQNLSKHGNVSELNPNHFLVLVEKKKHILKISTGNVVKTEEQEMIQGLIKNVNSKNTIELQHMYKKGLSNNTLTDKGGASLGLIDIARKSSDKIKYQFNQIDDQFTFFLFQTQIQLVN